MPPQTYATPEAFKQAAERRIRTVRKSHPLPASLLPTAPSSWASRYAKIARDDELPWSTIDVLEAAVQTFLDPLLAGTSGTWSPETWTWEPA